MIRSAVCFVILLLGLASTTTGAPPSPESSSESLCQFYGKDYDSPGFGIPYRSGFYLKARFGCNYRCSCPGNRMVKWTHVLEEKHFDVNIFSEATGGPRVAKWFICPFSVKENTWQPIRDELGRIVAYKVEINHDFFPARWLEPLIDPQTSIENPTFSQCNKP